MKRAKALRTSLKRMQTLLDVAPALPLAGAGRRADRGAGQAGADARPCGMPKYLSELAAAARQCQGRRACAGAARPALGQDPDHPEKRRPVPDGDQLCPVRSAASRFTARLADPQVSPGGAALVWVFDFTESHAEMARLRAAAARATGDFAALVGLIEAAPMPMWFRGSDLTLQLVNQAYVDAVGAVSAAEVVQGQIELLEPEDGRSPAEIARCHRCKIRTSPNASSPPPSTARVAPCA
jgi:PAS domain-containing protein